MSFLIVTHSKEVAAFANRSLELRDGRFVAEHGEGVDVENLSQDRELIIDETGTVTLPPDLLVRLGGAGRYTVGNVNSGYLSLQGEAVEAMGKWNWLLSARRASTITVIPRTKNALRAVQVDRWSRSRREALGRGTRPWSAIWKAFPSSS